MTFSFRLQKLPGNISDFCMVPELALRKLIVKIRQESRCGWVCSHPGLQRQLQCL